ncbi:MAG: PEGA domain-containing protein [Acidobacteriota bacterium]
MPGLAALCRLAAAACALALAVIVFAGPLLALLPTSISSNLDAIPGLGSSRGFVAQILSEPSGAGVWIDGVERGTTPFFGNVQCRGDRPITIEVKGPGFQPWTRELTCREGDTLRANARLERLP